MSIRLPLQPADAMQLLREVVAGREDFVYPNAQCTYLNYDGQPSCLVGHVLARAGVGLETIHTLDRENVGANSLPDTLADPQAATILFNAQYAQDSRDTWGQALAAATDAADAMAAAGLL